MRICGSLRVEGNGLDLDEDVVIPHLGQRDFLDFGLAGLDDLNGLHGLGEVGHCEGVCDLVLFEGKWLCCRGSSEEKTVRGIGKGDLDT